MSEARGNAYKITAVCMDDWIKGDYLARLGISFNLYFLMYGKERETFSFAIVQL